MQWQRLGLALLGLSALRDVASVRPHDGKHEADMLGQKNSRQSSKAAEEHTVEVLRSGHLAAQPGKSSKAPTAAGTAKSTAEKAEISRSLVQDNLFSLAWKPKTKPGVTPSHAKTVTDDNCADWKGHDLAAVACNLEDPKQALVRKWIPANATVMEFGARFGMTTCEIAKKIGNSGRMVSVEPDDKVWNALEANIKAHECYAHILRGAVSDEMYSHTFDEVEKTSGLKFDTLVIDCAGCAKDMMSQIGHKIKTQVNLILLEADMPNEKGACKGHCVNYQAFFLQLQKHGFEKVDEFNDCNGAGIGASSRDSCRPWIQHYAWRRRQAEPRNMFVLSVVLAVIMVFNLIVIRDMTLPKSRSPMQKGGKAST